MNEIIINSFIVGLITSILGSVIFRIILTKFTKADNNESINYMVKKYSNNYILEISLFFTGVLIHLLFEYFGFNKWYCEKKCAGDECEIICIKKLNN